MQLTLIKLFKVLPLWILYGVMALVIPFYMIFASGFKASFNFFRNRMRLGPIESFLHVYKNEFELGKVVLDRFASYSGKAFKVDVVNKSVFDRLCEEGKGLIMLTAHVGNFEMVGYNIKSPKKVHALVFSGETETIRSGRERVFGKTNVEMIPVVKDDLSHIFMIKDALTKGEVISITADRSIGSDKVVPALFFGEKANFPLGPFKLASSFGVPVIVAYSIKVGIRNYKVFLEEIDVTANGTDRIQGLVDAYSGSLERIARQYPDQWYNFYDFWS